MMSNLEPHHLYHVQVAAMNSQGLIGPFSTILQVRPQPSLAPDEDGEGGDFRGFGVEKSANVSQQVGWGTLRYLVAMLNCRIYILFI